MTKRKPAQIFTARPASASRTTRGVTRLTHTTPFPNLLLDEVMPRLNDTQWRLLCVIVRQTLGWQSGSSGERKERDWMTRSQLMARTGRNSEALSAAIDALVYQGMIEVQDSEGRALSSTVKRRGHRGRSYYALAEPWRQRIGLTRPLQPQMSNALLSSASSDFRDWPEKTEYVEAGKSNGTKETLTKVISTKRSYSKEELSRNSDELNFNQESGSKKCDDVQLGQDPEIVSFIALFKATASRAELPAPPVDLTSEELCRLKAWLTDSEEKTVSLLLEKYFGSRLSYIVRRQHSLSAFLDSRHILPLQRKAPDI
jgi:hypothetical protein